MTVLGESRSAAAIADAPCPLSRISVMMLISDGFIAALLFPPVSYQPRRIVSNRSMTSSAGVHELLQSIELFSRTTANI